MTRGVFTTNTQLTAASLNDCFSVPRCRVTNTAAQTIVNNTRTALTFDTETVDVGGMHSTSSNTSRLTVPSGGQGLYVIGGACEFVANATGIRDIELRINGSVYFAGSQIASAGASATTLMNVTGVYPLVDGDYVELTVVQTSGGNLNTGTSHQLWAYWTAVY